MTKYRFNFRGKGFDGKERPLTKEVARKGDAARIARNFDKNKIEYIAEERTKINGKLGWYGFAPSNYCQICGRALTVPESVQRGIGPECAQKVNRTRDFPESDVRTKTMPLEIANKVLSAIPEHRRNECKFCSGTLSSTVFYYEHESGWLVESLNKKVWIWIECLKCGHQWSLQHLGVSRSHVF